MQDTNVNQGLNRQPRVALWRVLILLVSGALSGAFAACLIPATECLLYGLPHVAVPTDQGSHGQVL
jgi:hypothetical protein